MNFPPNGKDFKAHHRAGSESHQPAPVSERTIIRAHSHESLAPGLRLGPYEIIGLVGSGGAGEVYRARDLRLGRTVALKLLDTDREPAQ